MDERKSETSKPQKTSFQNKGNVDKLNAQITGLKDK